MSLPRLNSQLQPILLKGHSRAITQVKYNADGDLLFTSAKDQTPTVWYAETGERLGTYGSHKGAVWDLDPSWDSKYLLTACADGNARLFETNNGNYICRMPHRGAVRAVLWSECQEIFATASDPFTSRENGIISIFEFPSQFLESSSSSGDSNLHSPKLEILVEGVDKATCLGWTLLNEYIIAGFDSGYIIKYNAKTGEPLIKIKIHDDRVNRISFNKEKTLFVTASRDTTSKLIDPDTLDVLKTYKTERPVNGAAISPIHYHVLLGGGQDAMSVTVTAGNQGKFETRFFHQIYEEEFGRVKGHFGPINAIAVNPNGSSYASGSEDGFIRLHHFDNNYISMSDYIPDGINLATGQIEPHSTETA